MRAVKARGSSDTSLEEDHVRHFLWDEVLSHHVRGLFSFGVPSLSPADDQPIIWNNPRFVTHGATIANLPGSKLGKPDHQSTINSIKSPGILHPSIRHPHVIPTKSRSTLTHSPPCLLSASSCASQPTARGRYSNSKVED